MKVKKCNICKIQKDLDQFYIDKKGRIEFCCKSCKSGYNRGLYLERMKNPEYVKKRKLRNLNYSYITRIGVPMSVKTEKWESQNKKCEICDKYLATFTEAKLDHNHKTGQIRGVLCSYCNVTLGGIENKEFLENAIKYLKKYETRETRDTGGTS